MERKGYPYPLYSLDLVHDGATPEEPRFVLPIAEGRLVVRPALRRRATRFTCGVVRDAVQRALAFHAFHLRALAPYGLDNDWAVALERFTERLVQEDRARVDLAARQALKKDDSARLLDEAMALRGRLQLCARLAGLGPLLTEREDRRRRETVALRSLLPLVPRLAEPELAGRLGRHGFTAADRDALSAALLALSSIRDGAAALEPARQAASDRTTVLRGALLGDLALLAETARRVLVPEEARPLQLQALLP